MKVFYLLFLTLMLIVLFIGESYSARRERAFDRYPQVGLIKYGNSISCASFIIKAGVLATAKHCFTHNDIDEDNFDREKIKVIFPLKGGNVDIGNITLSGDDIFKLILDRGDNDIAFILYNREKTSSQIDLDNFKVNANNEIEEGTEVFRAGFPMGENHVFDKVLTLECNFSGERAYFQATITDPGYEGLLFDTDCPAWFGDSGGPVFSSEVDEDGNEIILIHGVLSHTFDVDFAGNIMNDSISRDEIGEYVKTSMFSPFTLASDLQLAINEEKRIFKEKFPPREELVLKNYDNKQHKLEKKTTSPASHSILADFLNAILGIFFQLLNSIFSIF